MPAGRTQRLHINYDVWVNVRTNDRVNIYLFVCSVGLVSTHMYVKYVLLGRIIFQQCHFESANAQTFCKGLS
jgi:hypothetical protein